jgi:hypothetical protein
MLYSVKLHIDSVKVQGIAHSAFEADVGAAGHFHYKNLSRKYWI